MSKVTFNIKYVLPDGTLAGYHRKINGIVVPDRKKAFLYKTDNPQEVGTVLSEAKNQFEKIWNGTKEEGGGKELQNWSGWKGYNLQQIKLEAEFS